MGSRGSIQLDKLLEVTAAEASAQSDSTAPTITKALVAWGKRVYFGAPSCVTCHGAGGKGTKYAPNLADKEWLTGDGSYQMILEFVTHGIEEQDSKTGEGMPMRGWANSAGDDEISGGSGFDTAHILRFTLALPSARYAEAETAAAFHQELVDRRSERSPE